MKNLRNLYMSRKDKNKTIVKSQQEDKRQNVEPQNNKKQSDRIAILGIIIIVSCILFLIIAFINIGGWIDKDKEENDNAKTQFSEEYVAQEQPNKVVAAQNPPKEEIYKNISCATIATINLEIDKPNLVKQIYLNQMIENEKNLFNLKEDNFRQEWLEELYEKGGCVYSSSIKFIYEKREFQVVVLGKNMNFTNPKLWKTSEDTYVFLGTSTENVDDIEKRDLIWISFSNNSNDIDIRNLGNVDVPKNFENTTYLVCVNAQETWILKNKKILSAMQNGKEISRVEVDNVAGNEDFIERIDCEYVVSNQGILYSIRTANIINNGGLTISLLPEDMQVKKIDFWFNAKLKNGTKYKIPVYTKTDGKKYILLPQIDNIPFISFDFNKLTCEMKPSTPTIYNAKEMISSIYIIWKDGKFVEHWILNQEDYQGEVILYTNRKLKYGSLTEIIPLKKYDKSIFDALSYEEYKTSVKKIQQTIEKYIKKNPDKVIEVLKKRSKKGRIDKEEQALYDKLVSKKRAEEKAKKQAEKEAKKKAQKEASKKSEKKSKKIKDKKSSKKNKYQKVNK